MIEVAKVLKPHGLKGEIKLSPYTMDERFWKKVKTLFIEGNTYNVVSSRIYNGFAYVFLSEITTCEAAELLRGKVVSANKQDLHVNTDEYLIDDLEGCSVVDEDDNLLGYVESIEKYGAADIINVMTSGARYSFPFLERVIKDVDIKNQKIIVYLDKYEEVLV